MIYGLGAEISLRPCIRRDRYVRVGCKSDHRAVCSHFLVFMVIPCSGSLFGCNYFMCVIFAKDKFAKGIIVVTFLDKKYIICWIRVLRRTDVAHHFLIVVTVVLFFDDLAQV